MHDEKKIAIVDDHAMFRKGLAVLINLFPGYRVVLDVNNGKELVNTIDPDNLPDIILMDIVMPDMDGYQTTEWVKSNYPWINVLALSTMDSEVAIVKMIKSGAKGYVLKDADPEILKAAFEELLLKGYYYNEYITGKVLRVVSSITDENNKTGTLIKLSDREIEFLKLACTEMTYKEIADQMFVAVRTVEGYRDNLCEKLNLKSRVGLAIYAIKNQIVKV